MNKEQAFLNIISSTLSDNSFLGDDCAYLKDFDIVISQDSLIEDVHFTRSNFTPYQIGKKSALVNISDILASGAEPKYLSIAISGKLDEEFIEGFYKGVNDCGVKVIGGDLTGGDKLSISVCAIGSSRNRKISSRKNAKVGYIVGVKGIFGENEASNYTLLPKLYPNTSENIGKNAKYDYALMDSSDSLYDCLRQISKASGVKIEIDFDKIPRFSNDYALFSGEDYCLVGCFEKSDFKNFDMVEIGVVKVGSGVYVDGKEIIEDLTYEHF